MTALETLALGAAVAFIAEVVILLCLGRDEGAELADLAAWKASCQRPRRRKRGARREGRGVTCRHVG